MQREQTRRDVEAEFQFHIDTQVEDLVRQGLPEAEAQRIAHVQMGRTDLQVEKYRDAIGLGIWDEIGRDLTHGLRSLFRNPGLSCVAVLSLAIGIGGTTAMFTLIQAVLLHPFPYKDSDRIMNPLLINEKNPQQVTWFALMKPQFETLSRANSIDSLLGFRDVNAEITGVGLPEDVSAIYLTENAGQFFGVKPILGRFIQPSDGEHGGQSVVVLNYRFWQRHYQGNASVIGRVLEVDHAHYTIVGVMPRSFAFNDTLGVGDIYFPRSFCMTRSSRRSNGRTPRGSRSSAASAWRRPMRSWAQLCGSLPGRRRGISRNNFISTFSPSLSLTSNPWERPCCCSFLGSFSCC